MYIIGNICSGKTTLLNALQTAGFQVYRQDLRDVVDYSDMFENQKKVARYLETKKKKIIQDNKGFFFCDRHVVESHIFNAACRDLGIFSEKQFQELSGSFKPNEEERFIFLECPQKELEKRMVLRDRKLDFQFDKALLEYLRNNYRRIFEELCPHNRTLFVDSTRDIKQNILQIINAVWKE